MTKEKLRTFNEAFEKYIATEMQYQCARLLSKDGTLLVAYNQSKTPIKLKLKEIGRKLKSLPDGIYTVQCQHTQNKAVAADNYFIKKGNVTLGEGEEIIVKTVAEKQNPVTEKGDITSVTAALTRIEEISTLRAENLFLKSKIASLEKEVADLESDLDEAENMSEQPGGIEALLNGKGEGGGALKSLADLIPSLADSFFGMKNKELALREKELLIKNRTHRAPAHRFKVKRQNNEQDGQLDLADGNKVNEYFSIMENLEDADFAKEIERVKAVQPELFGLLQQEFGLDEDGNFEEQPE